MTFGGQGGKGSNLKGWMNKPDNLVGGSQCANKFLFYLEYIRCPKFGTPLPRGVTRG
jgi:hypothetical protein